MHVRAKQIKEANEGLTLELWAKENAKTVLNPLEIQSAIMKYVNVVQVHSKEVEKREQGRMCGAPTSMCRLSGTLMPYFRHPSANVSL